MKWFKKKIVGRNKKNKTKVYLPRKLLKLNG